MSVSATDWTIGNPVGLGYTNVITDQFVITNGNASTGYIDSFDLRSDGSYSRTDIFQNCNNCMFGMINPIDNTRWGVDALGNVFYTSLITPVDYSLGFYACCDAFGNPTNSNAMHKAGTITPPTFEAAKLTFDSSGNVYVSDTAGTGLIYKFVKEQGYTPQLFATIDATMTIGTDTFYAYDIEMDSSDRLHVLVRSKTGATLYLNVFVLSSTGALLKKDIELVASATPVTGGGLVLDADNPMSNYTYGYQLGAISAYLKHNSTTGTTTVATLTGITDLTDIEYSNFQIYIASAAQNLIRSYVTNYEGYGFSQIPTNPDGIDGTFSWVNGYGTVITTLSPGAALAYKWTISNELSNYTFYSGWSTDTQTEPGSLHDLTNLGGLGKPAVFPTSSNDLAGISIYGYLLAKRTNDSSWSLLTNPQILTISPAAVGFDSITLDKSFYNLTGDMITATFTYSSTSPIWLYQWQICSRIDCDDGYTFEGFSLADHAVTNTKVTDGMAQGVYYAVLMRHLPFLQNEILNYKRFDIRPPVIGVSWDKPEYNLLPKETTSTCQDSTPAVSYWSEISGYAGLQKGWFSCSTTPAEASANNSIMRGSLYAKYNGTFYLNNSLGSIWNGTLSNGSGAILYILTNSSATETWTLTGVNESGETFYASADVVQESLISYTISVSPSTAYVQDTLYLTFTRPVWRITDYVLVKDAGGTTIATFPASATSGTYYIDPSKQYTYGTWTAYWSFGSIDPIESENAVFIFTVKNALRPTTNTSIYEEGSASQTSSELSGLIQSKLFWTLVFIIGIMLVVSMRERRGQ